MWITLNNAFFSIVQNNLNNEELLVRARRAEDIKGVFGIDPDSTPERDYPYRISLPRARVAELIVERITSIDYGNFKDSIRDPLLHDACMRVWSEMLRIDTRFRRT